MRAGSTAPAATAALAGTKVAERYVVEEALGQGGMADVYRAIDCATGQPVALKRVRPELVESKPVVVLLFEREYHTLKQLAHPHIVEAHDYGIHEGAPYYTMELLSGRDLRELAPVPWREACSILRDVASALALMHSRRLLHRDVSPRNVRCASDDRVKLLDLGAMATFGTSGEVIGTPPCIAPETLHGQSLDARTDLYALGAVAYWLLTAGHAYPASTINALRDAWRSRPRPPSARNGEVPRELDDLVLRMISLDPLVRPVSAAEVIERLTVIGELDSRELPELAGAYLHAPPLVGREHAVLRFRKQMLRAGRGRGCVMAIEGPPGIGRTRMLHALELEGKLTGATVLRASAASAGEHGWGVVRALCRELMTSVPEIARREVEPLVDVLHHVLPERRGESAPAPAPELALQIEYAFADWLRAVMRRHVLVIAVDDAQRTDSLSLSALARLGRHAPQSRLVLALALDHGRDLGNALALTALVQRATRIDLEPLDKAQVTQLVASLFGDIPNLAVAADWLYTLSAGNPRMCMELAQHLVDHGIARYERGGFKLPASLAGRELPRSFEDSLERRLLALSDGARDLAHGLSLSDGPLQLDEYVWLLADEPENTMLAFQFVDELVDAGVLVTRDPAYAFSHGGYVEAARRLVDEDRKKRLSRRLAAIFARRGDLMRQAAHLLQAGDELEALATQIAYYDEVGGFFGFDRAPSAGAAGRATPALSPGVEDTAAAVRTREALLEVCERHGRPARESFLLRTGIMFVANMYDLSLMRGHVELQLQQLAHDAGAIYWSEFDGVDDLAARAKLCLERAQGVYDATPETERILAPSAALGAMMLNIGLGQGLGRQGFERALLDQAVALADFLRRAAPASQAVYNAAAHSLELVRGRDDHARKLRTEMLEYYEGLMRSGSPMLNISRIGRLIAWQVEGFDRARLGRADVEQCAEQFTNLPAIMSQTDHIWARRAWDVRRLAHLYQGNPAGARACQDEIDRLSVQYAYSAYDTGAAFLEAQACALGADLLGLKQSIATIGLIVERQYPCWEPFLHVANGDYHRLRGDRERALAAYDRALETTEPGGHAAWPVAVSGKAQTLVDLGAPERALDLVRPALERARHAELGVVAEQQLGRVRALADAACGRTDEAAQDLERLETHARDQGMGGLLLGVLCEARARVAIAAGDADAFAQHAATTAEIFRGGNSPTLAAAQERLVAAAREAKISLGGELLHATDGMSTPAEAHGFHTQFEDCRDSESRRRRALQLLLEHSGAEHGFIFAVDANSSIRLCAEEPERTHPPPELQPALEAYLAAELEYTTDITSTCFDDLADGPASGVAAYRPVLLRAGDSSIVGIAAVFSPGEFVFPGSDLVRAVSEVLVEQSDEVVSMFG